MPSHSATTTDVLPTCPTLPAQPSDIEFVRVSVPTLNSACATTAPALPTASVSLQASVAARVERIMIIDDEPLNVKVCRKYLSTAGYCNFVLTSLPEEALELMLHGKPDIVLLDIMMPKVSGLTILASMRAVSQLAHIPVIVLTAITDQATRLKALELGANEFLAKPVDQIELVLRVRNALEMKAYQNQLRSDAENLERKVVERTNQLAASHLSLIYALANAAEMRDDDTGKHVVRVGRISAVLARNMGMSAGWVEMVERAAQLHDVGKIGIPDSILLKPDKLTPAEFDVMKKHCELGLKILRHEEAAAQDIGPHEKCEVIGMARDIISSHHEKWDGSGYPAGIAGDQIPLSARIVAVADVFDALTRARPYKPAYSLERCRSIIAEGRGKHFDPQVVEAFFAAGEEIDRIVDEGHDR